MGRINISFSKTSLEKKISKLRFSSALTWLITLLAITSLNLLVFKVFIKRPLEALTRISKQFGEGDYTIEAYIGYQEFKKPDIFIEKE